MHPAPGVVVFDVNETLSDMSPLSARFADAGAPDWTARLWFASVLRDGFALAAAGDSKPFAGIAEDTLRALGIGEDAVGSVMGGFSQLPIHADVGPGVRALHSGGFRLVTLSNGAASVADGLLTRARLRDSFELVMSVDDAGAWKPAAASYLYAAGRCGTSPAEMVLVAVHPWDIHGAARAGLRTAWVNREGGPYPGHFERPTWEVGGIDGLAEALGSRPGAGRG